jgi:uncharacterized repeat protein (TIGR01451 family)
MMAGLRKYDRDTETMKKKVQTAKTRMSMMKQCVLFFFILITICLQVPVVMAEGTPAGTNIANQATVSFAVRSDSFTLNSNVTTTRVDEVIDVGVVWQDSTSVTVAPGDTNQVLTFRVTNRGNGIETFTLDTDSTVGGGEFNPLFVGLYLDTNGNGLFDAGVDLEYASDPVLPADGSITVLVLNNIPGGLSDGDRGNSRLSATSVTGNGAPGTVFATAGDGGTDAVAGTSGGSVGDTGTYLVSALVVTVAKSVAIADPFGGSEPVMGAVLTYSLAVTVTGSGTAEDIIITDAIPANTTYRSGSLTLNLLTLTDDDDGDAGDVGVSTPGVVTVVVGNLSEASPVQTIMFDVIIN